MLPRTPSFHQSCVTHKLCSWWPFVDVEAGLTNLMVLVSREQRPSALSGCPDGIKLCVAGGKGNKEKID